MATEVLAIASTKNEHSAEFDAESGTVQTFYLTGTGSFELEFKDSASAWRDTGIWLSGSGKLSGEGTRAVNLDANGTFRWTRRFGACGVQKG